MSLVVHYLQESEIVQNCSKSDSRTTLDLLKGKELEKYYNYHIYYSKASHWNVAPYVNLSVDEYEQTHGRNLEFEFPFYGHYYRHVSMMPNGFISLANFTYSSLSSSQYIAPFMISSKFASYRCFGNSSMTTFVWNCNGVSAVQANIYSNGTIKFVYKNMGRQHLQARLFLSSLQQRFKVPQPKPIPGCNLPICRYIDFSIKQKFKTMAF